MGLTLVVLAAGIGSRYGGLKQIDPVGPSGEIVIDYSVFDALRAGFDRVVCVIRREIEADFRASVGARFEKAVRVDYVFQDTADLPPGCAVPPGRVKPWGTGHAVLACRDAVREPFAVINADDFYGRRSYAALAEFLRAAPRGPQARYALVGFMLRRTLSEHGSVARGICGVNAAGALVSVVEHTQVERADGAVRGVGGDGAPVRLTGDETVSMNIWGFTPSIFGQLSLGFNAFLAAHGRDPKAEFYLPALVDDLIRRGEASVAVLPTPDAWFGVTYPADKPAVAAAIRALVAEGAYPMRLWG